MANTFDVGAGIRITATFRDFDGAPADPTIIIFELKNPDGTVTTPTVHQTDTGMYYAQFTVNASGTWSYHWEGTGALESAKEGTFTVRTSRFS